MFSLIQRLASRPGAASSEPLRGRDERLRAAFAAAPVGLGVAGFDGRWVLFNDAAATVLGYTREELARVSLHEITHADDRQRELDFVRRMAAGDVKRYQIEKRGQPQRHALPPPVVHVHAAGEGKREAAGGEPAGRGAAGTLAVPEMHLGVRRR